MKRSFKQSILSIITLIMVTLSLTQAMPVSAAKQSNPSALTQYINTDGTINLNSGYSGPIDIHNYTVSIDPKRGPIFRPLTASGIWTPLGGGLNNIVHAIAISGTDVIVGGEFTDAGGDGNADYLAKWNGTSWSALGSTSLTNIVLSIATSGTDIYVGGSFTGAGGIANADYIAKWNGTVWSALGSTPLTGSVHAIAVSGTDVYVGGWFLGAGANATYIAKWNGTIWSALGTDLNNGVNAIAISGTNIYVGGAFTNAGGIGSADYIAQWNGTSWSSLGSTPLNNYVYAIATSGANVYAGGTFTNAGGIATGDYLAKWDGTNWSGIGSGLNSTVNSIAISGANIYAGGWFSDAGGLTRADFIAQWNGTGWYPVATSALNTVVNAIAIKNGNVYAGGEFTSAGGNTSANYITIAAPAVTISFPSNDVQDGWVLEKSENSKIGSKVDSTSSTFRIGDDAARKQYRGILSFTTGASIPDNANIISVILKVKKQSSVGGGDPSVILKGFLADIQNGIFGSSGLQTTDFQAAPSRTIDPGKTTAISAVYSLNLTNGRASINIFDTSNGLTQIRLRFGADDNNDSIANYLNLYSGNTTVAEDRPQLVITYTVP